MSVFDELWDKYDSWYEKNKDIYRKELSLILSAVDSSKKCLEVGVGTGRFACKINAIGVDVSLNMLKIARKRGVDVILADASYLPFIQCFDFVLFIFTLCFLKNPEKALKEARRVLIDYGKVLICFIPKGKLTDDYKKSGSPFYKNAKFYSVEEVREMLKNAGFKVEKIYYENLRYERDLALVEGKKLP